MEVSEAIVQKIFSRASVTERITVRVETSVFRYVALLLVN
jgi:hypothetical protein